MSLAKRLGLTRNVINEVTSYHPSLMYQHIPRRLRDLLSRGVIHPAQHSGRRGMLLLLLLLSLSLLLFLQLLLMLRVLPLLFVSLFLPVLLFLVLRVVNYVDNTEDFFFVDVFCLVRH